jgi:GTP pyrophosphokinase
MSSITPKTLPKSLADKVLAYHPQADLDLLARAYDFSTEHHAGQKRLTGEPYIRHPLAVAELLAELEVDDATLAAALLHDVVEDTPAETATLAAKFGDEIALLVEGVTKLSRIDFRTSRQHQAANLRRMLLAMARDLRVILFKLADRLHNMQTLKALPVDRRKAVAEETVQIFAPIAHRLGVWRFKWQLEDLSLRYLDPSAYRTILRKVAKSREDRLAIIQTAIAQLQERLREIGVRAEIVGRPKHFYSIYDKMKKQGVDFDEILDLEAIRVIVDTIPDCYTVLGAVHSIWLPLPDMFTDYIAKRKPNMYRSLHTKVIGPHGGPIEVQIRTWEMHRTAEYGIAAHWRYKEGDRREQDTDRKLAWLRQLIDLQGDLRDPGEWLESLKIDLFKDQVFVFTPKGDVIDLPAGSTPIDFAYRIHTEVGNRCTGARVNGRMVPLSYVFRNGDVAEILTSKVAGGPSLDWLSIAVTSQAKSRIKAWFRRQNRDENVARGRHLLEEACRKQGTTLAEALRGEVLAEALQRHNLSAEEDLFAAVGYGDLTVEAVLHHGRGEEPKPAPKPKPARSTAGKTQGALSIGVTAKGVDGLLCRLSRCCAPVPGDSIIGYVTRGKGVTVHRRDCPNLKPYLRQETPRLIPVEWSLSGQAFYPVEMEIEALDRVGLLSDITAIISASGTNIRSARVQTKRGKAAHFNLVLDISDLDHLDRLRRELNALSDVLAVRRARGG